MAPGVSKRLSCEEGQSTVEWVGLCLVVAALIAGVLAAVGGGVPGGVFARAIASRMLCAAGLSSICGDSGDLVGAYGPELAGEVERNAPRIVYEAGMAALPVDFRSCRHDGCAAGPESGPVWTSNTGEPVAAFVHAVDCRTDLARAESIAHGYDCTGERSGNLYLQFWLYYPHSSSLSSVRPVLRDLPVEDPLHADDWEGMQVRVTPDGVESRATSHHGYNYDADPTSWPSDVGLTHRSSWGRSTGKLFVSGGSHAGHVHEGRRLSIRRVGHAGADAAVDAAALVRGGRPPAKLPHRLTVPPVCARWTPASRLRLIPIETLGDRALAAHFAIAPPWEKPVYSDPEDEGT
jgi:hypothetical protein